MFSVVQLLYRVIMYSIWRCQALIIFYALQMSQPPDKWDWTVKVL